MSGFSCQFSAGYLFKNVVIDSRHPLPIVLGNKGLGVLLSNFLDIQNEIPELFNKILKIIIKKLRVEVVWYMFRIGESFGKKGIAITVYRLHHTSTKKIMK
jgi:hypothetical protein